MNKSDRQKLGRAWNLIEAARLVAEKTNIDTSSDAIAECLLTAENLLTDLDTDDENDESV
jgi:hypothetical protein